MTVRDANLLPLPSDQQLILFLVHASREGSKYELVGTVAGAFRIDDQRRVSSLMKAGADYAESVPVDLDVFIARVKSNRGKGKDPD